MASIYTAVHFGPEEARELEKPDPQEPLSRIAARCPVHRGPDGTLMLMRMGDVVQASRHPDVLGPGAHGPTMGGKRPLPPVDLDGVAHTKMRRLLDPLFSAKKMAALEPQVRALADELINQFIDRGATELQASFCQPLPSIFFLRLMGLPTADLEPFLSFKNIILGHLPAGMPLPERFAAIRDASARCYRYLGEVLDARAASGVPGDNLIGWLITSEVDGQRLSREQILDIAYLLIIAGLDTVASSLVCIFGRLARAPELRRRLAGEPSLWPSAIEELLRFESPVTRAFRTTERDLAVGGDTIPAGTTFFLSWAAANLDPETFPAPLNIDLARKPNPHLAFGSGFHRCLGIQLARMELRAALEQFHLRIPEYRLKPGHELLFEGMPRIANSLPIVW